MIYTQSREAQQQQQQQLHGFAKTTTTFDRRPGVLLVCVWWVFPSAALLRLADRAARITGLAVRPDRYTGKKNSGWPLCVFVCRWRGTCRCVVVAVVSGSWEPGAMFSRALVLHYHPAQ